jgi:hypothetical protein
VHAEDDWDIPHLHSQKIFDAFLEPHLPALPEITALMAVRVGGSHAAHSYARTRSARHYGTSASRCAIWRALGARRCLRGTIGRWAMLCFCARAGEVMIESGLWRACRIIWRRCSIWDDLILHLVCDAMFFLFFAGMHIRDASARVWFVELSCFGGFAI